MPCGCVFSVIILTLTLTLTLLHPLFSSSGSAEVDAALTAAYDMGWKHDVLHPALPVLIIKRRAQLVKTEAARWVLAYNLCVCMQCFFVSTFYANRHM